MDVSCQNKTEKEVFKVIIWLNGAWGAGKTTTSIELNRRLENSLIFDPEEAGFYINKMLPKGLHRNDFQEFEEWRLINYEMLKLLDTNHQGIIIVPMTIINSTYIKEIIGKLQDDGHVVHHYILKANELSLNKRLSKRFEGKNSWARNRISMAINGLNELENAKIIETDELTTDDIIHFLARDLKLTLTKDTRRTWQKKRDHFGLIIKEKFS